MLVKNLINKSVCLNKPIENIVENLPIINYQETEEQFDVYEYNRLKPNRHSSSSLKKKPDP